MRSDLKLQVYKRLFKISVMPGLIPTPGRYFQKRFFPDTWKIFSVFFIIQYFIPERLIFRIIPSGVLLLSVVCRPAFICLCAYPLIRLFMSDA